MPDFLPFAGVRYDCDAAGAELDALAAPPYDVVDDDERAALEAAAPAQLGPADPARDEHDDGDRYDRAAADVRRVAATTACSSPTRSRASTRYRMEFRDAARRGAPHPTA